MGRDLFKIVRNQWNCGRPKLSTDWVLNTGYRERGWGGTGKGEKKTTKDIGTVPFGLILYI